MTGAQRSAIAYFVGQGWTPAQAAGIVANLTSESNLNPAAVGDGGRAYGIAQWHPDRQAHFPGLFDKPIQGSSLEDQLAFVHAELQHWEKAAGDALAACTTAGESGACISKQYERPADREGEAAKRAALAETLFQAYGGASAGEGTPMPSPTPADVPATPQQPESRMGALLLPLLSSVIGKFLSPNVAQNAMSIITKDGGQGTAAQNLINTLLGAVAGAAGTTPAAMQADDSVAIKAVAAVQSDASKLQAVEDAAAAHLNAVMPFVQQLAVLDQMRYEAEVRGKQTVSSIAIEEHKAGLWDMTQTVVYIAGGVLSAITMSLLAAIIYQSIQKGEIDSGLLGLSGPILMATVTAWAAIIAYRFDGSKESQAANEARRATERFREETGKA